MCYWSPLDTIAADSETLVPSAGDIKAREKKPQPVISNRSNAKNYRPILKWSIAKIKLLKQ